MARKILVAVDGSFHSRVALDFPAQTVLRHPRTSDELRIAAVLPPPVDAFDDTNGNG